MNELLSEYKVITTIKVQWGDMDAMRHVNNVVYVKWGEVARIDYFNALKIFSNEPEKIAYAPILGFQSVKYIKSLVYPDTVFIGTKVEEIKEDRIILKSYYFSAKLKQLVAIKTHEAIIFDYKSQVKILVPADLILKIENLENQ